VDEMAFGSEPNNITESILDFSRQKAREHAIQFMGEVGEFCRERGIRVDPFVDSPSDEMVQEFAREFLGIFDRAPRQEAPSKPVNRNKRRWSNIFHFKHHDRDDGLRKKSRGSSGSRSDISCADEKNILLMNNMKILSFNDSAKEKWVACRVALVVDHEIQKIEIYSPPKSTQPKTCIFCFLLEEIRNTTSLEVPDNDSAFVIKPEDAPSHVLIAEDQSVRDAWVMKLCRVVVQSKHIQCGTEPRKSSDNSQKILSQSSPNFSPAISVEDISRPSESPSRSRSLSAAADLLMVKPKKSQRSPPLGNGRRSNDGLLSVPTSSSAAALHPVSVKEQSTRKLSLPSSSPKSKPPTVSKVASMEEFAESDGRGGGMTHLELPSSRQSRELSSIEDNSGTELVDIQALIQDMNIQAIATSRENQLRRNTIDTTVLPSQGSEVFSGEEDDGEFRQRTFTSPHFSPARGNSNPSSPGIVTDLPVDNAESDPMVQMFRAPWYHGILLRHDCSALLQSLGPDATGRYLVRKSESVDGEYVLSFNYQGRAKHLRMSVNRDGTCKMQHLTFRSVADMLEHFKNNSIPLESPSIQDAVTLTSYVASSDSSRVRIDYNAFQQSRSNSTLRGRAQSFSNSSNFAQPSLQLRVGGRPVSRAVDNIYVRT
jgi:hypothetical protein